jgi:DNA-binding IclR family transcriptional regulator
MPFLEDLHAVVGHHVQLGVLHHSEVLFVERLSAPGAVINVTQIAGRLPLHASSAGLVLLAHAGPALQEAVLGRPLRAFTPWTITDPHALRRTLAQVRQQGFVHCQGHIHPDAAGLAVPVRDHQDRVVAALGIVVPNDDRVLGHVPVLRAMARGILRSACSPPRIPWFPRRPPD